MRPGVDNAIVWLRIVAMEKISIPGGEQSALLRMVGVTEHETRRGSVVAIEKTHIPLEARGRLAIALQRSCRIDSQIWVLGQHREMKYTDRYGEEQHKLMILVQAFEIDRKLDFNRLFKD